MENFPERPIVIGAGTAGLCVGWNLATAGIDIKILEKAGDIGGLALTFQDDGYRFDLGPHNIHTVYQDIDTFLHKILGADLREYKPEPKIFFRGRIIPYPIRGVGVLAVLPFWAILPACLSFLGARLKMFFCNPKNDDSFESWIKNRFGSVLYNIYFAPYVRKVWKVKGSEISSYVAEKRVPIFSITDCIRNLLKKPTRYNHSEDWTLIKNYYPRKGIGQIADYLTQGIIDNNCSIETDAKVTSIKGRHRRVEAVTYVQNGTKKTIATDFLFNTMPINDFINILDMDVSEEVRKAADGLDYCSGILLYLKTSRSKIYDTPVRYFLSPKIKFNRACDIGAYSRDCIPSGKTALCVEYTCDIGDKLWNATPDELFEHAMHVFEASNMLHREDVDGYLVKRITHAYPRFRVGFHERLKVILDYLSSLENVVTLGRQGLFCYSNVDGVLNMGFKAVEMLPTIKEKGIDYTALFQK